MKIDNKQDVINWLKRLKDDHPLSVGVCRKVRQSGSVSVYTDQVIRNRYQEMIDYLESDEVTSGPEQEEDSYVDTLYVDEGADDTTGLFTVYTKKDALKLIRDLMSEDEHLPEHYKKGDCSDDDAFEYAYHHYSIYRK